jgi:hypothetical protein
MSRIAGSVLPRPAIGAVAMCAFIQRADAVWLTVSSGVTQGKAARSAFFCAAFSASGSAA